MLKKLLRHEWCDTWRFVALMNVVVVVLTFVGAIALHTPALMNGLKEDNIIIVLLAMAYVMIYFAMIIALGFITNLYFLYRFYKNMYTDEGYLMHTLPVTSKALILAKAIPAVIWSAIGSFVLFFSMMFWFDFIFRVEENYSIWSIIYEGIQMVIREGYLNEKTVLIIILIVLLAIVTPFFSVFYGYVAISLGQRSRKHRLVSSIVIYLAGNVLIQTVVSTISFASGFFLESFETFIEANPYTAMIVFFVIVLIFYVAATALFYFITEYTMKNRLNLE